jgi:endonuclease/exonuclease/phosphatase family metal-dependent hydrolase
MTFNIHHAEGTDRTCDVDRIAEVIEKSDADVVALQEVDRWVPRSGKIDMMGRLADLTGMTYAFSRNDDLDGGVTGNGLLTRYPILEEKTLTLDHPQSGGSRAMMEVVLDVGGIEMVFVNTQFGLESTDSTRMADVWKIQDEVRARGSAPAVVMGSLSAGPSNRCIRALTAAFEDCWSRKGTGGGFTYPATSPSERMDYVFVAVSQTPADSKTGRSGLKPTNARVVATAASDHLPVVVDLRFVSE